MMRFPRWLSWIVLIGLGWILFVGNTRDTTTPAPGQPAAVVEEPKRYTQIEALFNGERWMKGIRPDYQSPDEPCRMVAPEAGKLGAYALIETPGTGEGLKCGDRATFTVARRTTDGSAGTDIQATLTLGEQPGFDGLLLGMREGERRVLIVNLPEKLDALPALPADTQLLVDVTRTSEAAVKPAVD